MYVSAGVGGVATVLPALESGIQSRYFLDQPCISGGSVYTIKKIADALVVTTKENGLEVNGEKTTYVIMSEDEDPGRSYRTVQIFGNNSKESKFPSERNL